MTRAEWAKRRGRSSSVIRRSLRFAIYARDGFDCVYCQGATRGAAPLRFDGVGLTLDHVVPRKAGGKSTAANMVTCCGTCNYSKVAQRGYVDMHPRMARRIRARVRRQLRKPIIREVGQWLARFIDAHRNVRLQELRAVVHFG